MQVVRSQLTQEWLQTALGEALLQQESRVVEEALDGIFGEHCLQLGMWGDSRTFLRFTRTQRCCLIAEDKLGEPSAVAELHRLPVESDSIDAVLLPHTLDYSDRPHAILREVDRVLRRNGQLVILGFKPTGLWGLRRLMPGAGMPPGADHLISDRRLKDWLQLLDMRIQGSVHYFFRWPLPRNKARANTQVGAPRPGMVARIGGMLYAHRAKTRWHADTGTAIVAPPTEGRCRPGRTFHTSFTNPF